MALSLVGCGRGHVDEKESDGTKVERGRLKFTNGKRSLRVAGHYLLTEGAHIYVNGSSWAPPGESGFASKMNWCDTSPNSDVEILRCFGDATENYRTTYILRMKGNKPDLQKLDEGVGSVWTDSDGRWLLFKKFYLNVETGEKIAIKGMPDADKDDGSAAAFLVNGTCSLDRDVIEDVAIDVASVGAGTGVLVAGSLTIDRSYITGATDYGVLAVSNGMSPTLSIKKSVIEKTVGLGGPTLGVGIAVGGPQMTLDLQDTLVEDVLGAGVEVSGSKGSIARTLVRRVGLSEVSPASYPVSNSLVDGVGDGILSIGGGDLSITDSWVESCARGAVVLSGGSHQLSGVRATQSVFGLALQDGATATVEGSNFSGNSTANKSDPASLDVPPYP